MRDRFDYSKVDHRLTQAVARPPNKPLQPTANRFTVLPCAVLFRVRFAAAERQSG